MKARRHIITLIGNAGLKFEVVQLASGSIASVDQRGEGIANESIAYILDYLAEKHGCTAERNPLLKRLSHQQEEEERVTTQTFYFGGLVMPEQQTRLSLIPDYIASCHAYKTCSMTIWFE